MAAVAVAGLLEQGLSDAVPPDGRLWPCVGSRTTAAGSLEQRLNDQPGVYHVSWQRLGGCRAATRVLQHCLPVDAVAAGVLEPCLQVSEVGSCRLQGRAPATGSRSEFVNNLAIRSSTPYTRSQSP
jgi:hypothetical protein